MRLSAEQERFIARLYNELFGLLRSFAANSLENDSVAEEIVQDTFVEAVRKTDVLINHAAPEAWLMSVLKFKLNNYKRSRIREGLAVDRLASDAAAGDGSAVYDSYPDMVEAVKSLTDEESCRMLCDLYIVGLSYAEVSEKYGITIDACKKRVSNAKKKLQKIFSENF